MNIHSLLEQMYGTQQRAQTLDARPTRGAGNPGGVYNQESGPINRGGQHTNLGRYRPPTMNGGSWNDQGGPYTYNLPNAYGPFPNMNNYYGTGGFGSDRPSFDTNVLNQLLTSALLFSGGSGANDLFGRLFQNLSGSHQQQQSAPPPQQSGGGSMSFEDLLRQLMQYQQGRGVRGAPAPAYRPPPTDPHTAPKPLSGSKPSMGGFPITGPILDGPMPSMGEGDGGVPSKPGGRANNRIPGGG